MAIQIRRGEEVARLMRLLGGVIKLGLVAAIAVGGVYAWQNWDEWDWGTTADPPLNPDYNCGLPGCGVPWLVEQWWDCHPQGHPNQPDPCEGKWANAGWFYIRPYDVFAEMYLPVATYENGHVRSWDEVYAMACGLYPQLGGSRDLTPMTEEDLESYGYESEHWYTDYGPAPNGGDNIYHLPPLSPETLAIFQDDGQGEFLATGACSTTSAAAPSPTTTRQESTTTTTKPETQRWQVSFSGHEIDLMNRYWSITTRVRGAIRYDYNLQGEFVLRKEDDKWVFDTGSITYAEVGISEEYWPEGAWEIRTPLTCPGCDRISTGRSLRGEVIGDDLKLYWGNFKPEVTVYARIIASCLPMPDCAQWKNRTYTSKEFFQRINGQLLPLADGATSSPSTVDPASGLHWLDYTITLHRLDS